MAGLEADDAAAAGVESAFFFGVEESGFWGPGGEIEDEVVDFIADFAWDV